ncbi:MocR-like transcription factor YczR [Mycolicibacterium aubagnense]|uniref:GntR family transcriptional regulator n=1 Tax=Mycolicibacterium aubagnense TaxID=319707 RepID=A0ABM7I9N9_9MYCO|nr:PLP-dependent aminotransferase family protein [Mycolicibacterium aubagnense]TLH60112.1 GntR family transcriptional regulator [Mycolicibacterium aubagnense]WGI34831.1 PLP-dependent aminotransferase family protein [Mycolicibacterium aubagnense]BBX83270.1 GntR family transcriptional regulator [Mycolicibacterium aubagnense]
MSIEMSARSLDEVLLARELGNWRTSSLSGPAYLGLADAIRLLIVDGRLPVGARYPSERALADALRVSRTTVTAAYAQLREDGYLNARRGARSTTALPHAATAGVPIPTARTGTLSLADAAPSAPAAATLEAFARAAQRLAPHLHDIGIELAGVAELRQAIAERYCARGLPTDPDEIMVTTGALHAINLVLATYARPGDRVLIEQPTYHGAISLIAASGARPVPVSMTDDGWELDAVQAAMRQLAPTLAYLIVDNHNPTGLSLPATGRERLARIIAETRTRTIIDETVCDIWLDEPLPPPLASYLESRRDLVITVGSMSKSFWGGLRVGWIRAERSTLAAIAAVRPSIDLGTAIFEQLASADLLRQAETVLPARRELLRARRELVSSLLQEQLPDWTASPCHGGMSMWMRLPAPMSSALSAAASRLGLVIPAGPRFGVDGTLERFIRVPYTQPEERLRESVAVLAQAWRNVTGAGAPDAHAVMV